MKDLITLKKNGFLLKSSIFSQKECDNILSCLKDRETTISIPFSNVPWGYGNLLKDAEFSFIVNSDKINNICKAWLGEKFVFNHLMINNKAAFIGPDVEWHQEEFNMNTYAPDSTTDENTWKNFLQIYIALDDQTLENGCLKIVPGSHNLGILPHEDIVNVNYSHKRRVPYDVMKKVCSTHDIMNVIMKRGDVLFFTHRILHASSSNASSKDRKSIIMQARKPFQRSDKVYEKETQYRALFTMRSLERVINRLKNKNIYNDFKKAE